MQIRPAKCELNGSVPTPTAMARRPALIANRNPQRETISPESSTPTVAPRNCAEKSEPACESYNAQRAERIGSSGPRSTVTIPIGTKAACAALFKQRTERAGDISAQPIHSPAHKDSVHP